MPGSTALWTVELVNGTCSLCEICVRCCPTGALRSERAERGLGLYFEPSLCNGCGDRASCEKMCPERAIRCTRRESGLDPTGPILLVESRMLQCTNCGDQFSPLVKVETVARKVNAQLDVIGDLCPVCRRSRLVTGFIDQRHAEAGEAEYRSTKEILRKAGYAPRQAKKA